MSDKKKAVDLLRGEFISEREFNRISASRNYDRDTEYEYAKDKDGVAQKVGSYTVLKDKKTGIVVASKKDE